MSWVDFIILGSLAFYCWDGLRRGFFAITSELAGFILSIAIGLKFYAPAATYLVARFDLPAQFSKPLGFIAIWVLAQIGVAILFFWLARRIPSSWAGSLWNRLAGVLPSLVKGLGMVMVIATLVVTLPLPTVLKAQLNQGIIAPVIVKVGAKFDRYLERLLSGVVSDTLTFLTIKRNSEESFNLQVVPRTLTVDRAAEERMLTLVNQERVNRNLKPLVMDAHLQEIARAHSRDMWERQYFSHDDPDGKSPFNRMTDAGISYHFAGENLALAPNVEIAHDGLMHSQGHRENILSEDFRKVGIGVIAGDIYGEMFTQDFTD